MFDCRTDEAAASAEVEAAQPGGMASAAPLEVFGDDDGAVPDCTAQKHASNLCRSETHNGRGKLPLWLHHYRRSL